MNRAVDFAQARAGESGFFAGVYRWMAGGLLLSALASVLVLSSPLLPALYSNPMLLMLLVIGQLVLVAWLSMGIQSMPYSQAAGMFCLYSVLNGVVLAPIFIIYTGASVFSTFLVTSGTFIFFSVYGSVTKTDLTSVGSLAGMGLFGIILASLVNWFFKSPTLYWVITYAGLLVFVVLVAYDTQKLKLLYQSGMIQEREGRSKLVLIGALKLYLDFINIFLLLLRIMGRRRD